MKKHFQPGHRYYSIFNKNSLKLSYSCSTNIENLIKGHNSKILNASKTQKQKLCNCRNKDQCPLNRDCLAKCIVYKAEVIHDNTTETYYGQCEGEFKTRYNNHTKSFHHQKHRHETELSNRVWKLKEEGEVYDLKWSIVARANAYKSGSKSCDLCTIEKVIIVRAEPKGLLNKRTELSNKCRHRNKFTLKELKLRHP